MKFLIIFFIIYAMIASLFILGVCMAAGRADEIDELNRLEQESKKKIKIINK